MQKSRRFSRLFFFPLDDLWGGRVGGGGVGGGAINACNETWDGSETFFFFSALPEFFICGNICLKIFF